MRRLLSIILVALLLAAFMTGCAPSTPAEPDAPVAEADDTSLKDIQDKGFFILGFDNAFPPMGFVDENNENVGFDIDVAKEVAKRLGVELRLQPINWDANIMELNSGNIDCLWNGVTITAEREAQIIFSDPYLDNAQVLVVMNDSPYQTSADLAGKKLGIQAGSSAEAALTDNAEFKATLGEVIPLKDNVTAMLDLEAGGIDAILVDSIVAGYEIAHSGKPYRMLAQPLANELYGIGFRKTDVSFRDAVNNTLVEMAGDGTLAAISTAWFSEDITTIGK